MRLPRRHLLLLVILLAGCGPLRGLLPSRATPTERMAASVTIARDEWGVPHVMGETDASVAFGLAYAQAEDDFWQIEEDYLHALGRASHWYGERHLAGDLLAAAFEVERLAREEYEREPPHRRAVWDAFAAGLNYYIRTSGVQPRLITKYEPWMPFALARSIEAGTIVDGIRLGDIPADSAGGVQRVVHLTGTWTGAADSAPGIGARAPQDPVDVSAMWVMAPSRTAAGHAMLLQSAGGEFFGASRPYEMLVISDSGWHMRGAVMLGTPAPIGGRNAGAAWAHTPSHADQADAYELTFDHPTDPLMYRFDDGWRSAVEWQDTLPVNSPEGVVARVFRFRRTHHGPVVAMPDGRLLAIRIARMVEGGALQETYDISRAGNMDELRAALDQRALMSNTMYADTAGRIFYLHGNAVPVRDTTIDWTQPVDGSTSMTEWRGYHDIGDLPQVLNPASGWIQSTGFTFAASAERDDHEPSRFPAYMGSGRSNTARARALQRLLRGDSAWTLAAWASTPFDARIPGAADEVQALAMEWERVGGLNPTRARRLDAAVELLRSWDHDATIDSEAATLFVLWQDQLRTASYRGDLRRFAAMEDIVELLERNHGGAAVPWGEVNRLQRVDVAGAAFDDERVSLPTGGAPAWLGSVFAFRTRRQEGARRRYGIGGTTWVHAVDLSAGGGTKSIVTFGQSADTTSQHWFDQAPLYARGELKQNVFTRDEIMATARSVYTPAQAAVRELP